MVALMLHHPARPTLVVVGSRFSSLQRPNSRQRASGTPVASTRNSSACLWRCGGAAAGLAALLLLSPGPVAPPPAMAAGARSTPVLGVPRVIDGDTLDFSGTRVRLFGIDAPETKQMCTVAAPGSSEYLCGERSKQALLERIGGATVNCQQKGRDKYGRVVGVCSAPLPPAADAQSGAADLEDLNAWMVQQGWAVAYRQYSKAYVALEEEARAACRGIWAGSFEVPQQWRIDRGKGTAAAGAAAAALVPPTPPPAAATAEGGSGGANGGGSSSGSSGSGGSDGSSSCLIKGNIAAGSGKRIYHIPGSASYERTKIDLAAGERLFCSEQEAQAAGWRRSQT